MTAKNSKTVKEGNKRLMITLPKSLIERLENDTRYRGLDLTKSARIQLALEKELANTPLIHTHEYESVEEMSTNDKNNEKDEQ